jgi:ENTH domain
MSIQQFGKGALRVAKNYTKGYSDIQAKVRDATSNDPWGPSGTQMNEIAQLTYNQQVSISPLLLCLLPTSFFVFASFARLFGFMRRILLIIYSWPRSFLVEMISWRSWKCWTNG